MVVGPNTGGIGEMAEVVKAADWVVVQVVVVARWRRG